MAHHRPYAALAGDLAAGSVASYNFITPGLCHDMHGTGGCPAGDLVRAGDDWLRTALPPIIAYVNAHRGVLFVVWDEGDASGALPFLALGPAVKAGHASEVMVNHRSLLKTIELLLGLPILPAVAADTDLRDLFIDGTFR